ncbi:hypothetical protein [Pseudosulfitobacter koreensis]|uniref:Uncharacterized protein n=1 Tax=Pseudosulfitobacter koreensis TaxID=2968472 RepID=A0ABT1YZK2_9RHOB|nr:hypothetical protein [Pseudosulfitobacter koreense]MCR8826284.1 hypothetical protein [Pseudosulfitobacter koreense]
MSAPKLTQASVKNAIAAAADLTPTALVVQPNGSLRLEFLPEQLNNATNSEPLAPNGQAPKKWRGAQR